MMAVREDDPSDRLMTRAPKSVAYAMPEATSDVKPDLDRHQAAETANSGHACAVVDLGRSDACDVCAMAERIGRALALDVVFSQNDFARKVWMVGIDARIHYGNDDGGVAQRGIPGLLRVDELRRPLRDVAIFGRWIGRGVIRIVGDEHRLHDIVEGHRLDAGLLLEARQQTSQRLSARIGEVQRKPGNASLDQALIAAAGSR